MKLVIFLLFIIFLSIESKFHCRLTRIVCEVSGKTIVQKPTCFIKTYNRQSYLTARLNVSRKIPNAKIDYKLFHKNSDGFRKILEFRNIEICKILRDVNAVVPYDIIKKVIDDVKNSMEGNLHEFCDIIGEVYVNNYTVIGLSSMEIIPAGDYCVKLLFHDEKDDKIGSSELSFRLLKK